MNSPAAASAPPGRTDLFTQEPHGLFFILKSAPYGGAREALKPVDLTDQSVAYDVEVTELWKLIREKI